jgi:oligoendopeptidase F
LLSLVINTIAKDKQIEDGWRGFARPVSSRNLANDVDDHVVDALVQAVNDRNADLSHRYYSLKARWVSIQISEISSAVSSALARA